MVCELIVRALLAENRALARNRLYKWWCDGLFSSLRQKAVAHGSRNDLVSDRSASGSAAFRVCTDRQRPSASAKADGAGLHTGILSPPYLPPRSPAERARFPQARCSPCSFSTQERLGSHVAATSRLPTLAIRRRRWRFAQSGECNYPMPRPNLARPHARMIRTRGAKSRVDCMRYCNAAAVETNTRVTLPRECSLGS